MSGSTIGGFVGGVFGFFIGGPAGAQIGFTIGSLVGGYVDPEQIIGPRLTDARTQTSQVGIPIPFGYGTFATAGNIIWGATYDGKPLREVRREESAKGGPEQVTFSYYRSYAIGICQGPIAGVLQIKRNGKVVYDARTDAEIELQLSGTPAEQLGQIIASIRANNAKFINRCTIYLGDEAQVADSLIESFEGVGEVSAFRGLAYMVVEEDDLTQLSGAIPQYEFVVSMAATLGAAGTANFALVAASSDSSLLHSGSASGVWTPDAIDSGLDPDGITTVWTESGAIFHLTSGAGRVSFDAGATFADVTGLPSGNLPNSLVYSPTRGEYLIFFQEGENLYYSTDGVAFAARSMGADRTRLGAVVRGSTVIVGASATTICRSTDGGLTWSDINTGEPNTVDYRFILDTGTYFLAIPTAQNASIRYSADGSAASWLAGSAFPGQGPAVEPTSAAFGGGFAVVTLSNGNSIYSGTGTIWTLGGSISNTGGGTQSMVYTAGAFHVITFSDRVFRTTDQGQNWVESVNFGVSGNTVYSIAAPTCQGEAIPDAPGFFLQSDGTICGADETQTVAPDQIVLGSIVADLLQREGLTADDYDVSELTDLVDGYGPLATEAGADSFIAPLTQAYFFDPGEWDGKLRFIKRGGAVAYSLGPDDLAERDGDAIEQRRVQEAELLRKVNVAYRDPAGGYGIQAQTWERRASTVEAKGEKTVEVNIVTDADTAARIAAKRGKVAWSETEEFKFSLPYGVGAKCTPTDVVSLTDKAGKVHRIRLMNVEEDSGVIEVEAVKDVQAAYTSNASGVAPIPPSITTPGLIGPTTLEVMNLPVLRDQDDELGVYVAVRGVLGGWRGAQVQISIDGGATVYTSVDLTQPSVIGYTTTALAGWVSGEYPAESSVTVYLPQAPESVSYEALLQYNNRAAIQLDSGEWAVLQYQTVVANGGNSYTLSGLVLGRYATDTGPAASGASFVLLDSSVTFVQAQTWMLGQTLSVRAVSLGTSSDGVAWESFPFTTAASQTEWPVHMVAAERDSGSDDVTVTWIGRARLGGETAPRHSKYFTGYRVAWDDGSTVTTADTTATTYTIPAAADPIDVTVTPLNSITGEGPASEAITV